MTRRLSIHLDMNLPDGFTVAVHESCRTDDKEPFCVALTKRDGIRHSHHAGFSHASFVDAFGKAVAAFGSDSEKAYWGAAFALPDLVEAR